MRKYDDFTYRVPVGATPPYVSCPYALDPTRPGFYAVKCAGRTAFNSPTWTINLGAQQTVPLGTHKLVLQADTQYKTGRYVSFEYLPFESQPASWTSNADLVRRSLVDRRARTQYRERPAGHLRVLLLDGSLGPVITSAPRDSGVRMSSKF